MLGSQKLYTRMAYGRSTGIVPPILNIRTVAGEWSPTCPKIPQYQVNKRLYGPERQSGHFEHGQNLLPLPEFTKKLDPTEMLIFYYTSRKFN